MAQLHCLTHGVVKQSQHLAELQHEFQTVHKKCLVRLWHRNPIDMKKLEQHAEEVREKLAELSPSSPTAEAGGLNPSE